MNIMNIGDIVVLKSGGPNMTISEITLTGIVCVWYDCDNHRFCYDTFKIDVLNKIKEN
ncbi:MAG: putative small protein [Bacteriophage sp.]|jgi:uncharacterized protein YodC (DUF2158 family)|uniref:Putative small protein n=1 Tax=Myoviridae sp. ctNQV2 TaxID=2827683 RepID=A0A8S5RYG7_9CAUD|nr:MAG: putative small protein [Bacteriophage sp.]UVY03184.1 MAG: putative small protein [Bacteriophage sp.]UWG15196.1 MAG: putative small protein [Bacteriophage sp.]UWI34777.1 MAG: Uncharacterized small protein [Bacteriophage sp.]DAF43673.1 MAG TPA: putative small protein [Myoviridae sp. ctNQV2]